MSIHVRLSPPSLRKLAETYMHHRASRIKPNTCGQYERLWGKYILPGVGSLTPITALEHMAVSDWHERLGKSSGKYIANRSVNLLSHGFELACGPWRWLPIGHNPCKYVERFPEPPRTVYCSIEDLRLVGLALKELRNDHEITPESDYAIRACILTGCRRNEILRLAWRPGVEHSLGHVDLELGALRYSDSKTGPKVIELSEVGWAFFSSLRKRAKADDVWVFRGHRLGSPLAGLQTAWERTRERAGLPHVQLKDLRRTFATALRDTGADLETIAQLLGHVDTRTTRIYALLTTNRRRELFSPAAARLAEALLG